jgi:hypothetical protein
VRFNVFFRTQTFSTAIPIQCMMGCRPMIRCAASMSCRRSAIAFLDVSDADLVLDIVGIGEATPGHVLVMVREVGE